MSLACGIGILLADQWTKRAVQARMVNRSMDCGPVVTLRFILHRKKSYERTGARGVLVLTWILALVCALALYRSGAWFQGAASLAGLGLAVGGAASNLLDILRYRYVVDFIDLGWWPVFNLADVGILLGLAAAFLG